MPPENKVHKTTLLHACCGRNYLQYVGLNMILTGMDFTMRFDWIDGNWNETTIELN